MDKSAAPSDHLEMATRSTTSEQSRVEGIPWLALASLLVVLMCIGASISIIVASDSQTVESWSIQPAVLLAILASLSTVALGFAFSAAVVATWWTSAMEGTSLAQLHYIWDRGEGVSFFSALAAGANARRVALAASVIVISKLATNPLLQRATHQSIDDIAMSHTIKLNAAQYIPDGWLGRYLPNSTTNYAISMKSQRVIQDWLKNATITSLDAPGYHCDGTCEGNVQGAGIRYTCSSSTQEIDLLTSNGTVIFAVNTTMSQTPTGSPSLLLTTLHLSAVDDTCTATLTINTCEIEVGIVEYPVILQNSTVALDLDKLNNVTVVSTYSYPGDFPTAGNTTSPGPLTALNNVFGFYYFSTRGTLLDPAGVQNHGSGQILIELFYQSDRSSYDDYTVEKCPMKWSSPTNYVLNTMQNFMFRTALLAASSTEVQTFTVRRTKPALVFHSAYGYLVAASAITLLGLLIILIMLQGWWVLGRSASLSPLETAKAFCAPLMERSGSNVTVDGILGDVGQTWVKYADGVMTVHDNKDIVREEGVEARSPSPASFYISSDPGRDEALELHLPVREFNSESQIQ